MNRDPLPGTFTPGFEEPRLVTVAGPRRLELDVRGLTYWSMGECAVTRFVDAGGVHLTVSHPSRLPTWDELKVARYRLLPDDATFALLMPPRAEYVDRPDSPNIMELTKVPTL